MDALTELRRRWLLVATVAVAAAGATAAFSFTAAKHYRATAVVVVQPTAPADLLGLNVLHDTSRRTAAATAALLLRDAAVAQRVSDRLGLGISGPALLRKVGTHVADGTDAVEVTVTDTSGARAAQIANGLVDGFLADRAATFGSQVHSAIAKLRNRLAAMAPAERNGAQGRELGSAIAALQRWVGFGDPTVSHGPAAVEPRSASWPHPYLWTLYGGLIGIGAGLLAALALGLATEARRRGVVEAAQYDRPMTGSGRPLSDRGAERIAQRLERRLEERVEALASEQTRLAAREAALETREREVRAKLEELRAAAAAPAAAPADDDLRRREAEVAARLEAVERRERAVAARAAELQELERRIDAQREALGRPTPERPTPEQPAAEKPVPEQPAQAQAPPQPVPAATEPAPPVPGRPGPAPPGPAPPGPSPPGPAPVEPGPPEPVAAPAVPNGGWRIADLEQLVEAHAPERPDRADEWRSYLFYLRDYVDEGGRIPSHFDWLVEDTFGELLLGR